MKKILLIEDHEELRINTAEILELSNYKTILAENGKIGILKAIEFKPDLIICDIMMPILDGYGVLQALQNNEELKNIPFIFLTAKTERSDFRKCMEFGADDYISKPFSATELLNAIDIRLKKNNVDSSALLSPEVHDLMKLIDSKFKDEALLLKCEFVTVNNYQKKQIIFSEGNHPYKLFYIKEGKVQLTKCNDIGKVLITDLLNAGDFFGYLPILESSTYKDTAVCFDEVELIEIAKDYFIELITQHAPTASKFTQLLANNISSLEEQLIGLAYNSLRKKVAEAIVKLEKKYNESVETNFVIKMSRENLATIAGTATESLIRTLKDFSQEKLIEMNNGNIKILNLNALKHLVI
jgi:CRP/FNR family cyclic AMP-dependent transcriptional regulator